MNHKKPKVIKTKKRKNHITDYDTQITADNSKQDDSLNSNLKFFIFFIDNKKSFQKKLDLRESLRCVRSKIMNKMDSDIYFLYNDFPIEEDDENLTSLFEIISNKNEVYLVSNKGESEIDTPLTSVLTSYNSIQLNSYDWSHFTNQKLNPYSSTIKHDELCLKYQELTYEENQINEINEQLEQFSHIMELQDLYGFGKKDKEKEIDTNSH